MAISPSIPTSFVPKQPVQPTRRPTSGGSNVLLIVSLVILALAIAASAAAFGYERYLMSVKERKAAELAMAQERVSEDTVEEFIRLRDRALAAETLLDEHVAVSQFFDVLENITLQAVRFTSLKLSIEDDRSTRIEMSGAARTFNALAVQSAAFASEKHIKRAIFSDISVNDGGSVSFLMTAELDPRLILMAAIPTPLAPVVEEEAEEIAAPSAPAEPPPAAPPAAPAAAPASPAAPVTPGAI